MSIENILKHLHDREIDYRLESNFCCGYVFYFLDGSVYPRRYMDGFLENGTDDIQVIEQSVDHVLERVAAYELKKDWIHRIEGTSLSDTFKKVEEYLIQNNL